MAILVTAIIAETGVTATAAMVTVAVGAAATAGTSAKGIATASAVNGATTAATSAQTKAMAGGGRSRFTIREGYNYRYYAPGAFLLLAFFGGNYWIGNPGYYQLAPAYGGTRWIRVGPDALLIRGYDCYVVRGIFY